MEHYRVYMSDNVVELKSPPKIMRPCDLQKLLLDGKTKKPKKLVNWTSTANQSQTIKPNKTRNVGIVCSPLANVFAVDIDKLDADWIEEEFGGLEELFKLCDGTPIQKTPKGFHILFLHNAGMKQIQNKKMGLDTRGGSTNGYVVMAGSSVNGKKYEWFGCSEKTHLKEMPEKLRTFLIDVVYPSSTTKTELNKVKTQRKIGELLPERKILNNYAYDFSREELCKIIEKLPRKYFNDYTLWLIFTSAMKQIGEKELWKKYSNKFADKDYNEDDNDRCWYNVKNINNEVEYFERVCKDAHYLDEMSMAKYKPLPKQRYKPEKIINTPYLTVNFNYDDYWERILVIQSDTGTGKTTYTGDYLKKKGEDFVSVVSRISLAQEQHKKFSELMPDQNIDYYKDDIQSLNNGVVIVIDSLSKLETWKGREFKNRVVFLDEFNSIVEYVLETPTLNDKRIDVILLLRQMIKEAKKVICVDADISDIAIDFIEDLNEPYCYIKNKHIHNNDTPATELFSRDEMMEHIEKEDEYLLCCDSKKHAIAIHKLLHTKDKPVMLYVAEEKKNKYDDEPIDLTHPRVIFSPKIVYGCDSVWKNGRPVYGYWTEKTISPTAFAQQLNRERNISHFYYVFTKKKFIPSKYNNWKEICEDLEKKQDYAIGKIGRGDYPKNIENFYIDILSKLYEKKDAFNTNKYAHFRMILKKRGFVVSSERSNTKQLTFGEVDLNENLFQLYNASMFENIADVLHSHANEYLQIEDTNVLRANKRMFCEYDGIQKYWNFINFYFSDDDKITTKLENTKEFECKKMYSRWNKIKIMKEWCFSLGFDLKFNKIKETIVNDRMTKNIMKEYNTIMSGRLGKLDLQTDYERKKFIQKAMKVLLGKDIITTKKKKIDGKCVYQYTFNKDYYTNYEYLFQHKNVDRNNCLERKRIIDKLGYKLNINEIRSKVVNCD